MEGLKSKLVYSNLLCELNILSTYRVITHKPHEIRLIMCDELDLKVFVRRSELHPLLNPSKGTYNEHKVDS